MCSLVQGASIFTAPQLCKNTWARELREHCWALMPIAVAFQDCWTSNEILFRVLSNWDIPANQRRLLTVGWPVLFWLRIGLSMAKMPKLGIFRRSQGFLWCKATGRKEPILEISPGDGKSSLFILVTAGTMATVVQEPCQSQGSSRNVLVPHTKKHPVSFMDILVVGPSNQANMWLSVLIAEY